MREKKPMGKAVKKLVITFASLGFLCYLVAVYFLLHLLTIKEKYSHKDLIKCFELAKDNCINNPTAILPINLKSLGMILAFSVFLAIFFYMKYKMSHYLDVDNPYAALGADHLMTSKEKQAFDRDYSDPIGSDSINGPRNMILSKDMRLLIDNQATDYNTNTLCIGGSGSGKSRFFVGPNILQANTNFIVTDPKGELLKRYGKFLEDEGYKVFVYNIADMSSSNHFNPFCYLKDEEDVATMVDIVLKNTSDTKDQKSQKDPFWDAAMSLLLTAISAYLWQTDGETKTWSRVIELVRAGKQIDPEIPSELDRIFSALAKDPDHRDDFCVSQYQDFLACGNGKTRDNVLVTCTARLRHFDLPKIKALTAFDDMDFENFANEKRALFVIIPSYKDTFNFIVSLMYSQLFSTLYHFSEQRAEYCSQIRIPATGEVIKVFNGKNADDIPKAYKEAVSYKANLSSFTLRRNKTLDCYEILNRRKEIVAYRGTKEQAEKFAELLKDAVVERCTQRLPNHTRFLMDEFANLAPISGFSQLISTMRSYEISVAIILQSLAQLKAMYDIDWQTISGNCDATIYLGGNESETTRWLSEEIGGKKTARLLGETYQAGNTGGSNSVSLSGVEVLSMSDLRQMKKDDCLVILKGLPMYKGKKYNIKNHPNFEKSESSYGHFIHQESERSKYQLKKATRKKRPLSQATKHQINNANQSLSKECLENKNAITQKPMISNMDMTEAMQADPSLRVPLAQIVLDATGQGDVKAKDYIDTDLLQEYASGI